MRILRCVAGGSVLLIVIACADNRGASGLTAPTRSFAEHSSAAERSPAHRVQASGSFAAIIDPSTFTFTPRGRNCLVTVKGQLVFSGTIQGTAFGETKALEFAPCSQVVAAPPGTYPDVFHSRAVFDGTVAGVPAHANLWYMGRTAVGGHIDGRFIFSNGVAGRLDVSAQVAVGGSYSGALVVN